MIRFLRGMLPIAAAIAFCIGAPAGAATTDEPAAPATTPADKKSDTKPDATKSSDTKAPATKPTESKPLPDKKSDNEFRDGYKKAYAAIYTNKDYAGGIAILRALGQDDHPDVANLIGFSSRKLGRVDDAKFWYEKALAADPKHTRTWQYYGMWHLEQGNRLKAEDHLEQIRLICGEGCEDYRSLRAALAGNATY